MYAALQSNFAAGAHTSPRTLRLAVAPSSASSTNSSPADETTNSALAVLTTEEMMTMEEVSLDDPDWADLERLEKDNSKTYTQHYHFRIKLLKVWRVWPNQELKSNMQNAAELGKATQLFHGTSPDAIQSILQRGFRLPEGGGMFGRGVYFAKCPLKSAQYSRKPSASSLGKLLLGCFAECLVGGYACGCLGNCVGGCVGCGLTYHCGTVRRCLFAMSI